MDFKVDENLPAEACQILSAAGHDAVSVLDQKMGGSPDINIAEICKRESRALITLDTGFANILAYPPTRFPGIIVIRTDDQSKLNILHIIGQIVAALANEAPRHHLWIVEHDRIRIRGAE